MNLNEAIEQACKASYMGCGLKNNMDLNTIESQFEGWWLNNSEDVLKICHGDMAGVKIKVVPVTGLVNLVDGSPRPGLAWGAYRDWTGTIIGEKMNGENEAYQVLITGNGVRYHRMTINKVDIQFLHE